METSATSSKIWESGGNCVLKTISSTVEFIATGPASKELDDHVRLAVDLEAQCVKWEVLSEYKGAAPVSVIDEIVRRA